MKQQCLFIGGPKDGRTYNIDETREEVIFQANLTQVGGDTIEIENFVYRRLEPNVFSFAYSEALK